RGLHTLCLLDIKADKDRLMSAQEAAAELLEIARNRKLEVKDWSVIVLAQLAGSKQRIVLTRLGKLAESKESFAFPQTIVVPGKLHDIEKLALERFSEKM
ncbi:MAG: diphthine synthase, partial [Candidatus Diapherotrites archaeon]|nr:diphthine synthase [Candidatus Diapherotrites archaeon]